jgi:hypothetical protein
MPTCHMVTARAQAIAGPGRGRTLSGWIWRYL